MSLYNNKLSPELQQSYIKRASYPCNLVERTISTYPSALRAYATRLNAAAPLLFETDFERLELPIRDLKTDNGIGKDLAKLNIQTPEKLTQWLGINVAEDPNDPDGVAIATSLKDPKCRFVYIYGINSRARLGITHSMLLELFTFHQVMPAYLDFILLFGLQSEAVEVRFSRFREQINFKLQQASTKVDALGRSGKQYQICYNLKGSRRVCHDPEDQSKDQWFITQAAFYHRLDVVGGNTLWIVTKGGLDIQQRFKELTGSGARSEDKAFGTPDECFRSSLSAHLALSHWSTEDWLGYIKWLEYTIEKDTEMAVLGPTGKGFHHRIYTTRDIQRLQYGAEKVRRAGIVLKANVNVMTSLQRFYVDLQNNEDFPMRHSCKDDIVIFVRQLGYMMDDFKLQIDRAESLIGTISERTELVKQHRLERLNLNLENEAIIVRIITTVTLVYLPATFVSTFFSTDIIKYQDQGPGGSFSSLAMMRWLQVTLPLTILTLLFAYIGKYVSEGNGHRDILPNRLSDYLYRSPWTWGVWSVWRWPWGSSGRKASSIEMDTSRV